jgi:nitroreductase
LRIPLPLWAEGVSAGVQNGRMELDEALRSTGAIREFTDDPVDDAVLAGILDTARFAPSGGNAQAWQVVVVKDPGVRRRLRDLYLTGWRDYLAMAAAGLRPWSPVNDRRAEADALAAAGTVGGDGFAEHLDEAPALLAVYADLSKLAAVDRDASHYPFAGGASIYPFAWSILLAARAEGLGGVITTMAIREEAEVNALLGATEPLALAAVIALGHPVRRPRQLRRSPVGAFTTIDRIGGPTLPGPAD